MGLNTRTIDFGLTGNEFQETFNVDKYVALAYQQPLGTLLQEQVELCWNEWCKIVAEAPWFRYWKKSKEIREQCTGPSGWLCAEPLVGNVPLVIYSTSVWGFGIEGWLRVDGVPFRPIGASYRRSRNPAAMTIWGLQGAGIPKSGARKSDWDDKIFRGCGMCLPPEMGDLDRWLQPMWERICISSK